MQKVYDCGIDLGTTNSCIAVPETEHGYLIIENQKDNSLVTRSAVAIPKLGRVLTGNAAFRVQNEKDVSVEFKREMGTNTAIQFESSGERKTPEELSSEILMRIKNDAEQRMNTRMENVVITVPAAFKSRQCEATMNAGKMAGFKNIKLLQEPVAASFAYGIRPDAGEKTWMVFDYGGGTLDVAIVTTANSRLSVINNEGNNYFGGIDLDRLIFRDIIIQRLKEEGYHIDILLDEKKRNGRANVKRFLSVCEECKKVLSSSEIATFDIMDCGVSITDDKGRVIDFIYDITRNEFEDIISDTVDNAIRIAKKAMNDAGVKVEDLDKIILAGGSTFIPLVKQRLREEFDVELESTINPMTVVAAGAAIYASTCVLDDDDVEIFDDTKATLKLTYEPRTSLGKASIVGVVTNNALINATRVQVDAVDRSWSSGWYDFVDTDEGIFDIDVIIKKEQSNDFLISLSTKDGAIIPVANPIISIQHEGNLLRASSPTTTATIGIEIIDCKTEYNTIMPMIPKNVALPYESKKTYKLYRDIDPSIGDGIYIRIWEGEVFTIPDANWKVGEIPLDVSNLKRFLPKGTEIIISIRVDEDRIIHVTGDIPDYNHFITEEICKSVSINNWKERMENAAKHINSCVVSVERLSGKGIEVSKLEERLLNLDSKYDYIKDFVNIDDGIVSRYLDLLYETEEEIIEREREYIIDEKDKGPEETIDLAMSRIEEYGDKIAKNVLNSYKAELELAEAEDEREHIINRMSNLGFTTIINSFDWLESFFIRVFIDSVVSYDNVDQAEKWKREGLKAIENEDIYRLREAVFKLLDLLSKSSEEAVREYMPDLTV